MARRVYPVAEYAHGIRTMLAQASESEYRDGLDWYPYAGRIAAAIAADTGHCAADVAGMIAALSPRNKWHRNVEDARQFARAAAAGTVDRPRAATFHANSAKAWKIARGAAWAEVLRGPKVERFIDNLLGDLDRVTVDVWAIRVCTLGTVDEVNGPAMYRAAEEAYQLVAAEVGLRPAELQAITWLVAKRLCNKAKGAVARIARLAA